MRAYTYVCVCVYHCIEPILTNKTLFSLIIQTINCDFLNTNELENGCLRSLNSTSVANYGVVPIVITLRELTAVLNVCFFNNIIITTTEMHYHLPVLNLLFGCRKHSQVSMNINSAIFFAWRNSVIHFYILSDFRYPAILNKFNKHGLLVGGFNCYIPNNHLWHCGTT